MATIAFLNSYSKGLSGGDQIFLYEIKKYQKPTIVTSYLGKKLCQKHHIKAQYIITSTEKKFSHPILIYLQRIIFAIILTSFKKFTSILCSSDILPDVLPSYLLKSFSPQTVWIQKIYHLIPDNRKISHLAQIISLKLISQKADKIIVDNSSLKNDLIKSFLFNPNKIYFQKPQIDLKTINSSPKSSTSYTAIYIGQLRKSKGIFDLVEIWQQVVKLKPNAILAIIGQDIDNNQSRLLTQINSLSLQKNIHILGFLPPNKMYSLLKATKLLLLPSYEEGYGMVVDEALACHIKVIVYDLPIFQTRFKNNPNVNLIQLGSVDKFSKKIINLVK